MGSVYTRTVCIRGVTAADYDALWAILEPIIRAGEVFAAPRGMTRDDALRFWLAPGADVFIAEDEGRAVGTCYVKPNQGGGGAHVANAGYATAPAYEGRGIASAMCVHSIAHARARGFRAMQFNFVVSTNRRAGALWERHGFAIVGRLPGAFEHPSEGLVDVLVMYRPL